MDGSAAPSITHLHVHSHFTLLGAAPTVDELAARAAADGMRHLALTDSHALYGAVAFARACAAHHVTPIIGMTVGMAAPEGSAQDHGPGLLTLLAAGPDGYRSLCRLSSHLQGRADRAELLQRGVDWELLREHRQGLLCIAGGRRGWIERSLRAGNTAAAARIASRIAGLFDERAYLAVELHRPGDEAVAHEIVRLGQRFGLPPVAVQPVYCMAPDAAHRLRLLAAIDRNCRLEQVPGQALPDARGTADLHWLAPGEMIERFRSFPAAIDQMPELVARCEPALPDGRPIWPRPALPDDLSPAARLAQMAEEGLAAHYPQPTPALHDRLAQELAVTDQLAFAPLFLVVADIARFARSREIPFSTRGSVANSLVAYCIGITSVDPVAHDLLFERFLNPERAGVPDIDMDFCSRRRDEVLDYVRDTYGADRVALVATISTMRLRSAVRETAKAHGLDEAAIDGLVRSLRERWHPDPRRRSHHDRDAVLAKIQDPRLRQVVAAAFEIVGVPHHLSIHPGGVVITPGPLTDVAPVQWAPKGYLITQFDHGDLEAIGLPKIDLLGIRALTVLADATALVRRHHDPQFRLAGIPPDDAATGDMLAAGDTIGVFQCESSGAQRTLRQLKARSVRDLAVANAFFKPGPATGGMAQHFIRRYRGEEAASFLHPSLAAILAPTQGVLLFQEQILRVAHEIAGLSWAEADRLRRGMSKFQPAEMDALAERFIAGCLRSPFPGFSREQASTLWDQVQAFSGYGFNQGHATAYADVSYRSAYLKAHWPAAFLCARLADWGGFHHQAIYIAEAQRLGMDVRPPHVNHSGRRFTLAFDTRGAPVLWMGLGQVRDLRRATLQALLSARRSAPFGGLRDLLSRVDLHPKELTHLIQCGGLDGLGASRAGLLAELNSIRRAGGTQQMAFDFVQVETAMEGVAQRAAWEQAVLGQPLSVHPLQTVPVPAGAVSLDEARRSPERSVAVAAFRLPGWTGGHGVFVGDGRTYAVAIEPREAATPRMATPRPWQPLLLHGRWRADEWGSEWFQVDEWQSLPNSDVDSTAGSI